MLTFVWVSDPSGSRGKLWPPAPEKAPCGPQLQVKQPSFAAHPGSQTTTPGETSRTLSPPVTPFPVSQPSWCPKLTPASPRHGRAHDLSTNRGPSKLRLFRHSPILPCGALHAHPWTPVHASKFRSCCPSPLPPSTLGQPSGFGCTLATYPLWQETPREEVSQALGTELQGPRYGKVAWKEIPAPRTHSLGLTDSLGLGEGLSLRNGGAGPSKVWGQGRTA